MKKKFSAATSVTLDSDGNQRVRPVSSDVLQEIYDKRKSNENNAARYLLEIAEAILLGAPMAQGHLMAAPFMKYARDIENTVDHKTAAKNLTNELGITTNNKRPSHVTDREITQCMHKYFSIKDAAQGNTPNISEAYKCVAAELGVSRPRVTTVWKKYINQLSIVFMGTELDEDENPS